MKENLKLLKRIRVYGILFFFISLILLINKFNIVLCRPEEDYEDFNGCHDRGAYSINSTTSREITVKRGENFSISIVGSGPRAIIRFNPISEDNRYFQVYPDETIKDNSPKDEDLKQGHILVNFILTAPAEEGSYKILFYIRSPTEGNLRKPYIDFIVFHWFNV